MSLLDDLRNEVSKHTLKRRAASEQERNLHGVYQDEIRPRMHEAYRYFIEFFDHLEKLENDAGLQMELLGYDQPIKLQAGQHYVRTDSSDKIGLIECSRRVTGDPLRMSVVGKSKAAKQCRHFDLVGLEYEARDWFGGDGRVIGAKIEVAMNFLQKLSFKVDRSTANVELMISNFRRFSVMKKRLQPEELNKENFDLIGLYILGRSDSLFVSEQTLEVSADARKKLQEKLAEDKQAKAEELSRLRKKSRK